MVNKSKRKLIIFTDIGDTIIDEGTEIRTEKDGVVHEADCFPGAKETYLKLYADGFTIVMVADGLVQSFDNTMRQNGLKHIFTDFIISEAVGASKPSALMFQAAMDALGLTDEDKSRIIMVGNNTERDIKGANAFGIRSVLFPSSDRHPTVPQDASEEPTYTIQDITELYDLVHRLETELN